MIRHDFPPGESSLWRFRFVRVIWYEEPVPAGI